MACFPAPVDEVTISILSGNDVQSGDEMVLRCSVKEGTGPVTFQFYKEKEGRPFHEETVNDTQVFWHHEQASKEQEGQYYCTAFNRASIVTSLRSGPLTVRGESRPHQKPGMGASKGQKACIPGKRERSGD